MPALKRLSVFIGNCGLVPTGYQHRHSARCGATPGALSPPTQIGIGCCTGFGVNTTSENFTYLPSKRGSSFGPQLLAGRHPFVSDMAAIVERRGVDRLEFLAAPADADAERQPALRQIVDGREDLRGQHRGAMRHHHHRQHKAQLLVSAAI